MRNDKLVKSMMILVVLLLTIAYAQTYPSAPTNITNNTIDTPAQTQGTLFNATGGSISNLTINTTNQNYRWKGYVGRVNGIVALTDASSNSLYDWTIETISGEVYATRNSSIPDWDNIECASNSAVINEQEALNINTTTFDSINRTFNGTTHNSFYVGISEISSDSCRAIALNVNSTRQYSDFQEILLSDGAQLIYAGLIENSSYGFDNSTYDFQMIVAEDAAQGSQTSNAYYFYVELV